MEGSTALKESTTCFAPKILKGPLESGSDSSKEYKVELEEEAMIEAK
jgi:hypothetical protein